MSINRLIALNSANMANPVQAYAQGQNLVQNRLLNSMKLQATGEELQNKRRNEELGAIAYFGVEGAKKLGYPISPEMESTITPDVEKALRRRFKTGAFEGSSMDAQAMNIIQQGDTSSRAYSLAHNYLMQPRTQMTPQGMVQVQPTLPNWVAEPTYVNPGVDAASDESSATVAIKPVGQRQLAPNQVKYNTAHAEASKLVDAYNNYVTLVKEIVPENPTDWARVSMADRTRLNSAYGNLQLAAKGKSLFDLGVLAGPDLDMIEKTMLDPTSVKGMVYGKDAILSSVGETGMALSSSLMRLNDAYTGGEVQTKDIPQFTKIDRPMYTRDGRRVTQKDLEYTAKKHGKTVEQVKQELGIR